MFYLSNESFKELLVTVLISEVVTCFQNNFMSFHVNFMSCSVIKYIFLDITASHSIYSCASKNDTYSQLLGLKIKGNLQISRKSSIISGSTQCRF